MAQAWMARKGRKPHDWAAWFDGATRIIRRGTDFDCKVESMKIQLYMRAPEHGGKVTIEPVEGDAAAICFRFYKPEAAPAEEVAS